MSDEDKAWYYFVNLRTGRSIDQHGEHWTTEQAASENERVARTMGKHFRYVMDVEASAAEWVEERD